MKKLIASLLCILTLFSTMIIKVANAKPLDSSNLMKEEVKITDIYDSPINPNVTVTFIDEDLKKGNDGIKPCGVITKKYNHSYYKLKTYRIVQSMCGPVEQETVYASLAKGETRTVTDSTKLSATLKISSSYEAKIADLVKATLGIEASGSIEQTWSSTTTLTGPPESSPYNTRLYIHLVNYNLYAFEVDRYDVYDIYNGTAWYDQETVYYGTEYVNQVKKPVFISTEKDVYIPINWNNNLKTILDLT